MVSNEQIVQIFTDIGEMLEVLGENPFRVRAYQRAAEVIRGLGQELNEIREKNEGMIEKLPGIGRDLHGKIVELLDTGKCEMHERLVKKLGPGVLEILHVRGIGPKKVKLFMEQLGIVNVKQLEAATESGALATLPGMGEKSQEGIREALRQTTHLQKRTPYLKALKIATAYLQYLRGCEDVKQAAYAGSLRRKKKTIGDVDLLVTGGPADNICKWFFAYPNIKQVLAAGDTKAGVVLEEGMQVDLRVVDPESFGAALFYFTGPKHFNIHVRTLALKRGWKINEYGLFEGEKKLAGQTEEELFAALALPYLEPWEREDFNQ